MSHQRPTNRGNVLMKPTSNLRVMKYEWIKNTMFYINPEHHICCKCCNWYLKNKSFCAELTTIIQEMWLWQMVLHLMATRRCRILQNAVWLIRNKCLVSSCAYFARLWHAPLCKGAHRAAMLIGRARSPVQLSCSILIMYGLWCYGPAQSHICFKRVVRMLYSQDCYLSSLFTVFFNIIN